METSNLYKKLDDFHSLIVHYFNGDFFRNIEKYFFYNFVPLRICRIYAREVVDKFIDLHDAVPAINKNYQKTLTKKIAVYEGRNASVIALKNKLLKDLKPYLLGAYVHGSLATDEEIDYSDFDALLIFERKVFQNHEQLSHVCSKVLECKIILYEYDPLQHHGFFVLSEIDLSQYPQEYFPLVLFDHAKSLFDDKGVDIAVRCRHFANDGRLYFQGMADAIRQKLCQNAYPRNYYQLKLLLSQVMLLPSLFLQAKGQYVFKKDSFHLVRRDISNGEWGIMEEISDLRKEWDFTPSVAFRYFQKIFRSPFIGTLYQKKIGQKVSPRIRTHLTEDFYSRMLKFVKAMELELETFQSTITNSTKTKD